MITISKIPDGKNWADAIAQYRSKGMRTNFYAAAEEFLPQLQWLSELKFDGGCYLSVSYTHLTLPTKLEV